MSIRGAVKSEIGKVRSNNEDAYGYFPDAAFYVVADGMGGHVGGEVASKLAVTTMRESLQQTQDEDLTPILDPEGHESLDGRRLLIAIESANKKVFGLSQQDPKLAGMGTTVAALLFEKGGNQANLCHVGDSRIYRIRGQKIEQLTEDHSLVQQLVREGKLSPTDARVSPHRNVLLQALGIGPAIQPSIRVEVPLPGDIFVLCSDGVHGVIEESEIFDNVVQVNADPQKVCDGLVDLANARGGPDNCTVIILRYEA